MVVKDRTLEMEKRRKEMGRNSKRFSFKKKNSLMDILMKEVKHLFYIFSYLYRLC
jgi:hypothetical protein